MKLKTRYFFRGFFLLFSFTYARLNVCTLQLSMYSSEFFHEINFFFNFQKRLQMLCGLHSSTRWMWVSEVQSGDWSVNFMNEWGTNSREAWFTEQAESHLLAVIVVEMSEDSSLSYHDDEEIKISLCHNTWEWLVRTRISNIQMEAWKHLAVAPIRTCFPLKHRKNFRF